MISFFCIHQLGIATHTQIKNCNYCLLYCHTFNVKLSLYLCLRSYSGILRKGGSTSDLTLPFQGINWLPFSTSVHVHTLTKKKA